MRWLSVASCRAMAAARITCAKSLLGFGFLLVTAFANAQALEDCLACHEDVEFSSTAHPDVECNECHTNIVDKRHKRGVEPLTDEDSCGNCHGRELRTIGRSIHAGQAACLDCHEKHATESRFSPTSHTFPRNVPELCSRCHAQGQQAAVALPDCQALQLLGRQLRAGQRQQRQGPVQGMLVPSPFP